MEDENIRASLKIRLLANEVTVAESSDATLWQQTLGKIMGKGGMIDARHDDADDHEEDGGDDLLATFASQLRVSQDSLVGSIDPTNAPPFIYLDMTAWEAFRRNTPPRGKGAIPPIVLAATALALWFRVIEQGNPTQAQAQGVLATINLRDKNPTRSLTNCDWLQNRNGTVVLNPQYVTRARNLISAFVNRTPFEE